jgi:hypothetical protein
VTVHELITSISVILALLSGAAWMKSAVLQLHLIKKPDWLDNQLNRISREPNVWNAIAAFLAAFAAMAQAILYVLQARR